MSIFSKKERDKLAADYQRLSDEALVRNINSAHNRVALLKEELQLLTEEQYRRNRERERRVLDDLRKAGKL